MNCARRRAGALALLRLTVGVCAALSLVACSRLGDISGPTPIGGSVVSVSLSSSEVTLGVGSTMALQAVALDRDGRSVTDRPVMWSSSDAGVVEVSSSGLLTAVSTGTAQIAVSVAGRSAVAQVTVIARPVASIEVGPLAPRILTGGFVQLVALPRDETGAVLSDRILFWSTSDIAIASVDGTGFVSGISAGTATITVRSENREAAVAVVVSPVPVASVVVSPRVDTVVVGQSTQLTAVPRDSVSVPLVDRLVAWSSASSAVATVSASGLVLGVAPGTTTISATTEDITGVATIVVLPRPIGAVIVSPSQATLTVGQSTLLSVQVTDQNGNLLTGRDIFFTSDNTSVVQVSSEGVVRAVGVGSTTVRVTSEGQTGIFSATVLPTPVASVRVDPPAAVLNVGDSIRLSAVALDVAGNPLPQRAVTWTSGAPGAMSVSSAGVVHGLTSGTGLIFAVIDGRLASASITVNAPPLSVVQVTPPDVSMIVGGTFNLTATVRDANGELADRQVMWSSVNPLIAVVSSGGTVRALALGATRIDATVEGVVGSATVRVVPVPVSRVTVVLTDSSLNVDQTAQATATLRDAADSVLTGRAVVWTSSSPSIASVTSGGVVTGVSSGSANIIATSEGISGSVAVTVLQLAGALSVQTQPSGATSGSPFTTQPVVRILDAQGNLVTTGPNSTLAVTASRESGTATLSGTLTVSAVGGIATFTNLAFTGTGTGAHTLRFATNSPALTVTSAPINVVAGPAARLVAASTQSQSVPILSLVSDPPQVLVTDAGGNPVGGRNVTFTVTAGLGSTVPASGSTLTTNEQGRAGLSQWRLGPLPGLNTVTATSAGLTGSPLVFSATATIGAPTQLAITTQPAGGVSGRPLTTQPVIEVRDVAGNRVPGAATAVTASVATGDGETGGTVTVNAVDGVATFTNLRIDGAGPHTLIFSAAGLTSVTSNSVNVTQIPASLTIQVQPAGSRSGAPLTAQPVIHVRDDAGILVTTGAGATLAVSATIASGGGSISGNTSVNAVSGVATFTNLTLTGSGSHTIRFSTASPSLAVVSAPLEIEPGAPVRIVAASPVSISAPAGSTVSAAPSVRVTDGAGSGVSGVEVTFNITAGNGSTVPESGSTLVTNASGLASLSSWTLGIVAGVNTVTATATGLDGSPVTFNATGTPGPASRLAVATQPSGAVSGAAFVTQPVVHVRDAHGNRVTNATNAVTAQLASGTGTLEGITTVNAVNGIVTFTDLRIDGAGDHTLEFISGSLVRDTSDVVSVVQMPASLAINTQPGGAASGVPFTSQPVLHVLDNAGELVTTGAGATIAVTAGIESGDGTLSGTKVVNAVGGVVTFTDLEITGVGPHTIRFSTATPALSAISASFNVGAGAAAKIAAVSDVSQSAPVSSDVDQPPAVRVTDANENPVAGVQVTFEVTAGGGTTVPASGATLTTNADGIATLTSWTLGAAAGINTVTATAAGLDGSPVSFTGTGVAPGATQLSVTTQPTGAVSGVMLTTQPVVEIRDANGNLVPDAVNEVHASIASGSGTLVGTTAISAVDGVATFTNLRVDGTGNHTIRFTATGLSPDTSGEFTVTQVAASLIVHTQPAGAASGVAFTTQPVVHILDNAGLPVTTGAGATLELSAELDAGDGTLSGTKVVTAAAGVATFTDLMITGVGTHRIEFSTASPSLSITSANIEVGAGAASKISAISDISQSAPVNMAVDEPPSVRVSDANENPVAGVEVTFEVTAGGGSTVPASGAVIVTNASGVATLTSWTLGAAPGVNTVSASAEGLDGSPVIFTGTAEAPSATQLAITTAPGGAVSGLVLATQPVIEIRDADGNPVPDAVNEVVAALASGSGTLVGNTAVTAVGGIATFANLRVDGPGDHSIVFTATGLSSATSAVFTVTQTAASLAVHTQPDTAVSGTAFSTQPVVHILDNAGLPVTTGADASLTVSAAKDSGDATLSGTAAVQAVNGVATFTDLLFTGSGVGAHTIVFTTGSPELKVTSASIMVIAGEAHAIEAASDVDQEGTVEEDVDEPPRVRVVDVNGNPVSGVKVVFTVTEGEGTIEPAAGDTIITNASGIAALTRWTLGEDAGKNAVEAAAAGLQGSPVEFTATASFSFAAGTRVLQRGRVLAFARAQR